MFWRRFASFPNGFDVGYRASPLQEHRAASLANSTKPLSTCQSNVSAIDGSWISLSTNTVSRHAKTPSISLISLDNPPGSSPKPLWSRPFLLWTTHSIGFPHMGNEKSFQGGWQCRPVPEFPVVPRPWASYGVLPTYSSTTCRHHGA